MPAWSNPDLLLFHGTDMASVGSVATGSRPAISFAPSLARSRPNTDFGQGFYTTTSLHQAMQWANTRVVRLGGGAKAAVISFSVSRDALATLESLVFVRAIPDFWDLVRFCRSGGTPLHGRVRSPGLRFSVPGVYEVVYGPVTLWPQKLVLADCDQVSFHTTASIGLLPAAVLEADASGEPDGQFQ